MKNRLRLNTILTGLFVVLVLASSRSISRAQTCFPLTTTSWVGTPTGNGEFFDPANWSAACRPNGQTNAFVNNGAGISAFDTSVSSIAHLRILVVGENQGDSGSVKVDQSAFINFRIDEECREGEAAPTPSPYLGGDTYIGRAGKGTLVIGNGNLLMSGSAFVAAIANPNGSRASSSVTVLGSGTIWRFFGPCVGHQLCIGCDRLPEGGTTDSGGTGSVTVNDPGRIEIYNDDPASPGLKVGISGTLAGNGIVKLATQLSACSDCQTAKVLGTFAPNGQLKIQGNLDLSSSSASAVVHVQPQGADSINVMQTTGFGHVKLGGRLTVVITGNFSQGQTFNLLHADGGRLNNSTFAFTSIIDTGTGCYTPTIVVVDNSNGSSDVNLQLQPRDRCD